MDLSSKFYAVLILFAVTMLINLPLGYSRARVRKYSLKWFLYIHLPIPLIFLARTLSHIEFKYVPIFVLAALIGQIIGGKLNL